MKKNVLKFFVVTIVLCSLFSTQLKAQEIKLGGGLIVGTDIPPLGLQFKGTYGMDMLLEKLSGSLEFALFFPSTQNLYKHSRWTLDIDGNYTFWKTAGFDFYGIAGLNITHYKKDPNFVLGTEISGTKPGLNIGAGVNYSFSQKFGVFSEIKYSVSSYNQTAFSFGVLFTL